MRRRATVHCIDCGDDLGVIKYDDDHIDDAFFTSGMLAEEHRAGLEDWHSVGVIVVDEED